MGYSLGYVDADLSNRACLSFQLVLLLLLVQIVYSNHRYNRPHSHQRRNLRYPKRRTFHLSGLQVWKLLLIQWILVCSSHRILRSTNTSLCSGSTSGYCDGGCQSGYGSCNTWKTGDALIVSDNGLCGDKYHQTCQGSRYGNCCSKYGNW